MKAWLRLWPVLVLDLGLEASLCAIEVGDSWRSPPEELGKPVGLLEAGGRALYRWPDLEILVEAGRVTRIRRIDPAIEAAATKRRAEALAAENERLAAEYNARMKAAAASEALERAEREERERLAKDAKIAELERQNEVNASDLNAAAKRQAAERAARGATLRNELSVLRFELGRAREAGDTEKAGRLSTTIRVKAREWRMLQADPTGN